MYKVVIHTGLLYMNKNKKSTFLINIKKKFRFDSKKRVALKY